MSVSSLPKVWFITGASRGLGLSITEAALSRGDSVIATSRNTSSLKPLLEKYGEKILPLSLDVTSNSATLAAISEGHKHFGRIDVLVNNAGYADTTAVEDMPLSNFLAQINTNFLGVVYATKAVLPIMRAQKEGHIIQISSLGGRIGNPGLSAYQSAKWAVGGFSTVLAQEVKHLGIKVTVLEPGGMRTDWAGSSMARLQVSEPYHESVGRFLEYLEQIKGDLPSKPDKVAEIVLKVSGMGIEECPVRLLVGTDAVQWAQEAARKLKESDEKWRELSVSSV